MSPRKDTETGVFDENEGISGSSDFEDLLSKELLELSIKERNDIQEEIHGVSCVAREETPELVQESLHNLALALDSDDILPGNPKRAYKISQELQQRLQNNGPEATTIATTANKKQLYVFGDDFRLRFLRLELFDVTKAAQRIILFLDLLLDYFGVYALERPIRLSDFSVKEMMFLKKGFCQPLPFRDSVGRRIIVCQPNGVNNFGSQDIKNKVFLYILWAAGLDADTQRRGLVLVAWFDSTFTVPEALESPINLMSVRASALHICSPRSLFFESLRHILSYKVGKSMRVNARVHLGSSIELKYKLQSFGIPIDLIPTSLSGKIKTIYLEQWMRTRNIIEERQYDKLHKERTSASQIIECPLINDFIFKQGTSLLAHPGNAVLRNLIETKHKAQEVEYEGRNVITMKRRQMVLEIYEEIKSQFNGRFLIWNDGMWNEISDREQTLSRIEYLVKDYRKSTRAGQRRKEAYRRRLVGNLDKSDLACRSMIASSERHIYADSIAPFVRGGPSPPNSIYDIAQRSNFYNMGSG